MKLRARLFDDKGRFLREETAAAWSLDGLKGTVANGAFTVATDPVEQAGIDQGHGRRTDRRGARARRPPAAVEGNVRLVRGRRRARRGGSTPSASQLSVTTLDGQKVLQKAPLDTIFKRVRVFIGPTTWSNYTFEADVRAAERRRQMGDIGITAQRYSLVLYGTSQRLKIEPWEPETTRTVTVPFAWKPDTWYRLKLRVENLPNGQVRARGKAWPVRRGRARGVADRQDRSDRQPPGGARVVHRRPVRRAIWITSPSRRISRGGPSGPPDGNPMRMHPSDLRVPAQLPRPRAGLADWPRASAALGVRSRHRRLADVGRHARPQHGVRP